MKGSEIPRGHESAARGGGPEYKPTEAIMHGAEDDNETYWNSFLPIFFDRIGLVTRRVMTDCVRDYGLTGIHANYIIALSLKEGLTLVELSHFLDIDAANTNRVIKTLKEKGLVYDNRPTPKSKKFNIFLTEDGKMLAETLVEVNQACMNGFFKGIPKFCIDNMRFTLIKMIYNSDPEFEDYVDSKLVNPFFTYMSLGWGEEASDAIDLTDRKYRREDGGSSV